MASQQSHTAHFTSRYKFNAVSRMPIGSKELDQATGYYYYGARYYDPAVSQWLSVDPLAQKYPAFTPYNYTANNPIRFIDADGEAPEDIIIRGINNSSFTIKTDLIDTEIKLSSYGISKDFGGNRSINARDLAPDAIGVDFNASASIMFGGEIGVNILWHTRGEKDSDKYYPEIHTYAGFSKGSKISAGGSVGVLFAWARNGKGGKANSSWVANGLNWTGKFDSESFSLGSFSASHFSSKAYADDNYWEGFQLSYSPTKLEFGSPDEGIKALKSVLDEPKMFGKVFSGNVSTTNYYMIYGNGSDHLTNGTDVSGLHLLNPIDPTDDKKD